MDGEGIFLASVSTIVILLFACLIGVVAYCGISEIIDRNRFYDACLPKHSAEQCVYQWRRSSGSDINVEAGHD